MANPFAPYASTYGPGAILERPWWRRSRRSLARTDGVAVVFEFTKTTLVRPGNPDADVPADTPASAIDGRHPLPVPPPLCGQVWSVAESECSFVVLAVDPDIIRVPGRDIRRAICEWPPPGAVLVAGPLAPWAPVGWTGG